MNMEGQPAVGAEAPDLNLLQRVMLAFTAPSKLGEFLQTRQPWFWTLAIVGIVSVILFMLVPTDIFREAIEQQMRDRAQGQEFDAETAVQMGRIFGTLGALLGTLCIVMVYAVVRQLSGHPVSAVAAAGWYALHPGLVAESLNGLETSLAVATQALCVWLFLRAARAGPPVALGACAAIGLAAGLMMLARTGEQIGAAAYASVKCIPSAAIRSMFGVS